MRSERIDPVTDARSVADVASPVDVSRSRPGSHFVGPVERPDEYELVGVGRRGGEGIVFHARYHGSLPHSVAFALKQLLPPPGVNPSEWPDRKLADRWNEQLKLLHLVRHDHLAGYRELFWGWPPHPASTCTGQPPGELRTWYLVMEWVEGASLHDVVLKDLATVPERLRFVAEVAFAIDHLHSGADTAGMALLHRDIKPGNIIVHPTRGAVLVDYGLLRVEEPALTEIPAWTGPYLAPEVHADKTRTSKSSDLWAVAATAFFAATGRHPSPFDASRMRTQLEETLPGVVSDPAAVTDALMSVLDRQPGERPSSPSAWGRRLLAVLQTDIADEAAPTDSSSITAASNSHKESVGPTATQKSRSAKTGRRRSVLKMIAIFATLLLIGTGVALGLTNPWRSDSSQSTSRRTNAEKNPSTSQTPTISATTTTLTSSNPAPTNTEGTSFFTSPPANSATNNTASITPSPVACGFSDPNPANTFAPGFTGAIEPATSLTLPSGSTQYFFVGSDAGGNPITQISWPEDLSVVASYSSNKSISIGRSPLGTSSFDSGTTTNVAIAGLGVAGYKVVTRVPASTSAGTTLSLQVPVSSSGILLLVVGGEGAGLLRVGGSPLQTLMNATYSECGSNVIASAGMFAAEVSAGNYPLSLTSSTYGTNSGASLGAVAYVLSRI